MPDSPAASAAGPSRPPLGIFSSFSPRSGGVSFAAVATALGQPSTLSSSSGLGDQLDSSPPATSPRSGALLGSTQITSNVSLGFSLHRAGTAAFAADAAGDGLTIVVPGTPSTSGPLSGHISDEVHPLSDGAPDKNADVTAVPDQVTSSAQRPRIYSTRTDDSADDNNSSASSSHTTPARASLALQRTSYSSPPHSPRIGKSLRKSAHSFRGLLRRAQSEEEAEEAASAAASATGSSASLAE